MNTPLNINIISHIENHANNTPDKTAIYRRVIPIQNNNNYYILILCIILFLISESKLFGIIFDWKAQFSV